VRREKEGGGKRHGGSVAVEPLDLFCVKTGGGRKGKKKNELGFLTAGSEYGG